MTNRDDATLTCSEVVERLGKFGITSAADRAEVLAILHSWRERRVQELEEALREEIRQAKACVSAMRTMPTNSQLGQDAVLKSADQRIAEMEKVLLAEWREQIRKGAKHE